MALYANTCAFTGRQLQTPSGLVGLDAAHVVPVRSRGSDHPVNGIALAKDIHWAFDKGLIGVSEGRTIIVPQPVCAMRENRDLAILQGKPIGEANIVNKRASSESFAWHRANILLSCKMASLGICKLAASDLIQAANRSATWPRAALLLFFNAHSQTTPTRHANPSNASTAAMSRFTFPSIFFRHSSARVSGQRNAWHSCPCQKHPCTNTTARCFGNTKSGLPGREVTCSLNRNPALCTADRTHISGCVFFALIAAIFLRRVA